jgi:hypothetical protein
MQVTRLLRRFCTTPPDVHTKHMANMGIYNRRLVHNPTVPHLYEIALLKEPPADPFTKQTYVASNGALCAFSGLKTGR